MPYKKLEISNPCTQNWDKMPLMSQGRYCGSCKHIIHDFSEMNTSELLQMLQTGKYSCGRFDKIQMGTFYLVREKSIERKKYWSALAAAIISGILQVSVSYSQTPNKPILVQKKMSMTIALPQQLSKNTESDKPSIEKQKFSFRVVDSETKKPLQYIQIELMGLYGITDSAGRVDFELNYDPAINTKFIASLFSVKYEDKKVKMTLKACYNKLTVIYVRKNKKSKKKEYLLGYF